MKHILSILLLVSILLSGCSTQDSNAVLFYYCRDPQQYQYFEPDAVIRSEARDLLGHRNDLKYMLGLYLAGPLEEDLVIPCAKSTRLLSVTNDGGRILIELSDHNNNLTDSEFSLACACLALTCMDFTQCGDVTITSGERSVTMNSESIILADILPQQETTGG